jgi:hypothetical protein
MKVIVVLVSGALALSGCAAAGPAISQLATAGVAGAVGSATGSALLGVVAGAGTGYGFDQGVKYAERRIQGNVQQAVATTAGPMKVGEHADWQVPEKLPLSGRSGRVEVVRGYGAVIACKDVAFTIAEEDGVYVTTICRSDSGEWRWATAEPSIHRWGYLQ